MPALKRTHVHAHAHKHASAHTYTCERPLPACLPAQIMDIKAPVFRALLHFVYADCLPDEHEGPNLEVPMAQHLLVAADQYELNRLRGWVPGLRAFGALSL